MMISKLKHSTILMTGIALVSVGVSHAAHAETLFDQEKIGLNAGLSVMLTDGPYDVEDSSVKVLPSIVYDNDRVYARGSQVGGYLVNDDETEVTAFLQAGGYTFEPEDANGKLAGLNEREWSGMAGISYQRRIPYSAVKAQIARDVLGNSKGTLAKLSIGTRYPIGGVTLYPSAGVEWANDTFNDYYFGVSSTESNKTGIEQYEPSGSINPYINLNALYEINDDWMLSFGQNVTFLSDEQADSPMVDKDTTYRTTLGLLYKF